MKREYLGDTYDAVKRFWQELLADWAPLQAEPRFFPRDLRQEFTQLTKIPMLTDDFPETYSILNDPDTGIRLPGEQNQEEGRTHISIPVQPTANRCGLCAALGKYIQFFHGKF